MISSLGIKKKKLSLGIDLPISRSNVNIASFCIKYMTFLHSDEFTKHEAFFSTDILIGQRKSGDTFLGHYTY